MTGPGGTAGDTTATRRTPGEGRPAQNSARTRGKRLELLLPLGVGCGFVAGLAIGQAPHALTGGSFFWTAAAAWGAVLAAIAASWWASRMIARRRLDGRATGGRADTGARQAIEHALTTPGCAVAHSVRSIARTGTIDHLVATPLRLWVIETKHDDVPRDQFPKVLRQVADHTSAVWEWTLPGTPVRGCLVLARGAIPGRRTCGYGHEPVVLHTPASLLASLPPKRRKNT